MTKCQNNFHVIKFFSNTNAQIQYRNYKKKKHLYVQLERSRNINVNPFWVVNKKKTQTILNIVCFLQHNFRMNQSEMHKTRSSIFI